MSCEKYQNLISDSIDGNIDSKGSHDLAAHLSVCPECAKIKEDFGAIANFYDEGFMEDSIPPNSQALWCRINNIIETEVKAELLEEEAKAKPEPSVVKKSLGQHLEILAGSDGYVSSGNRSCELAFDDCRYQEFH